jgi:S13-like protein
MISLAIGGCTYTSGMVSLSSRKALAERASRLGGARRGRSLGPDIFSRQGPLEEHRLTPERSLDQRMDALSRANEVRVLRAQLKHDLKAGRVSIGALLLDPPACLGAAKVFDMLLAVPKVGSVKATKLLNSCRISSSKTFGGLSERQRAELAERFDG